MLKLNEVMKFLDSVQPKELEKRVINRDFNDHFLAMRGCKQHSVHHKEGDVLTHTDMVINEAKKLVGEVGNFGDIYLLSALCHDIGKPIVTEFNEEKKEWTAYKHGKAGAEPAAEYLRSIGAPEEKVAAVVVLVNRHLDPFQFIRTETKAKGYRKLRKELDSVGVPVEVLAALAKADHFGRITDDDGDTEATIAEFIKAYKTYEAEESV